MFDIGWPELLLLMIVAVVVVGPKDLPKLMSTIGRYVGQMRRMAAEFQRGFEDLARETELEDLKKEIDKVGEGDILSSPPPIRPDEDDEQSAQASTSAMPTQPAAGERG
ncbi:MAG: Sec-independent protein translocase protein TatB [Candidatus Phaeomarinobacter sp.]